MSAAVGTPPVPQLTVLVQSLSEPPPVGVEIECRLLADHRLAYLDYEGPISGGRGSVAR